MWFTSISDAKELYLLFCVHVFSTTAGTTKTVCRKTGPFSLAIGTATLSTLTTLAPLQEHAPDSGLQLQDRASHGTCFQTFNGSKNTKSMETATPPYHLLCSGNQTQAFSCRKCNGKLDYRYENESLWNTDTEILEKTTFIVVVYQIQHLTAPVSGRAHLKTHSSSFQTVEDRKGHNYRKTWLYFLIISASLAVWLRDRAMATFLQKPRIKTIFEVSVPSLEIAPFSHLFRSWKCSEKRESGRDLETPNKMFREM